MRLRESALDCRRLKGPDYECVKTASATAAQEAELRAATSCARHGDTACTQSPRARLSRAGDTNGFVLGSFWVDAVAGAMANNTYYAASGMDAGTQYTVRLYAECVAATVWHHCTAATRLVRDTQWRVAFPHAPPLTPQQRGEFPRYQWGGLRRQRRLHVPGLHDRRHGARCVAAQDTVHRCAACGRMSLLLWEFCHGHDVGCSLLSCPVAR